MNDTDEMLQLQELEEAATEGCDEEELAGLEDQEQIVEHEG